MLAAKTVTFLLLLAVLGLPLLSHAEYLEMKDGAKIYYEDRGQGQPVVLIHGWTCSTKFWQRNAPELAKEFRVVTIDLRGHGNSSKILSGHTISQYARDVRAVIQKLDLKNATLVGWSLGGPVVLSYYQQFGSDRVRALGLVDSNVFPFSPAEWNGHPLKNYNYDLMNATFAADISDPKKFATAFTYRMFKDGKASDKDVEWITAELLKTPIWISIAIYSDFAMSDYVKVLPTVKVPTIVFAGDSAVFKNSLAMGKSVAGQIPHSTFVPIEDGGHLLFYEQPEKFNRALAGFMKGLK
jgi:pimeloyl-ACP methyl ester carboxylesterase